jgi:hypothetical protein
MFKTDSRHSCYFNFFVKLRDFIISHKMSWFFNLSMYNLCIFVMKSWTMNPLCWTKRCNFFCLIGWLIWLWIYINRWMCCYNKIRRSWWSNILFFFRNYKGLMSLILRFTDLKCWWNRSNKLTLARFCLHSNIFSISMRIRRWRNTSSKLLWHIITYIWLNLNIFLFWGILTFKGFFFIYLFRFISLLMSQL